MTENKILIYAGTTEGRRLAEFLVKREVSVHVCVATEYGESLLPEGSNITTTHERMDENQMIDFINEYHPSYVVDATHPYAIEVTENLQNACEKAGVPYLRILRDTGAEKSDCIYVDSMEEAIEYLEQTTGNILATTGSKELAAFQNLTDYKKRVYARVLSTAKVAHKCEQLGFTGKNLICMQGPFSVEMNYAIMKSYDISYMVTKDSGNIGGFLQKYNAAKKAGVKIIVLGRQKEESGYTYEEIIDLLKEEYHFKTMQKVTLAGIGMGTEGSMTVEVKKACEEADVLIGASRMLKSVVKEGQQTFAAYKPEEITDYIFSHPQDENIVVVLSGDPGFYSGAKKLILTIRDRLKKSGEPDRVKTEILPGISTVSSLCAKLQIPWEDIKLVSIHGREENLLAAVKNNKYTFTLTGSAADVRKLAKTLIDARLGDCNMAVGAELTYEGEQILKGNVSEFLDYDGDNLAAVLIANPYGGENAVTHGMNDEEFIRGDVPMTKEEVRSISLSKMKIRKSDIIYDIGAGTGSVSVESAIQAEDGQVYAVEINPEAAGLIEENARKFAVSNIKVIEGSAPEILKDLPAPDCVFIGGSKGRLEEILELIRKKNPQARVVLNAISLETLAQTLEYCRKYPIKNDEIVQVNIAKSKVVGSYHMMTGQNPIYVISFELD